MKYTIFKICLTAISLFFLLPACANYKLHKNPAEQIEAELPSISPIDYQLFFVGDLGHEPTRGLQTLQAVTKLAAAAGEESSLILLGDICGRDGLSGDDETEKIWLDQIIAELQAVEGDIFYTPGDNELARQGNFGRLQRLEQYFERHSEKKVRFWPKNACSGPDDREVASGIGVIGASSAWYLADWRNEEELSEGCDHTDRHSFLLALADEIKSYRDQVKIVLMHHPLASKGNRGGYFSARQHLFPLTDLVTGAYLPLPIIGSLARGVQTTAGSRRNLSNLLYKELTEGIESSIEDEDMVIFLGGHEHNMLYMDRGNHHIITAGSGSQRSPAAGSEAAAFSYGAVGFGELSFHEDGSIYLSFHEVAATGQTKLVFQRQIIADRHASNQADLPPVPAEVVNSNTVSTTVYAEPVGQQTDSHHRQGFRRTYHPLYYQPIELAVLGLDTIHGGLTPIRRGGGMTTQSLHTRGGDGHRYQLRSVRKNPIQLLPGALEQSFAADLTKQALTALHPFAPLSLPPWQERLNLLHIKPQLIYLPKQDALGSFNDNFGGEMYYLEQRPDGDWRSTGLFGNSKDIVSNSDARAAIMDSWKHQADQRNFLRSRLFDLWLGDWDRHRDQWRWAIHKEDGITTYTPIARDRDQVFSNFEASIIRLAAIFVPEARKVREFGYDFAGGKWRFTNGRWNDRFFLNEMEEADFIAEAEFIISQLDDDAIDAALQLLPPEVLNQSLEEYDIDGKLKARRDLLPHLASLYYHHLAKEVDITASNKDDVIVASCLENGDLLIEIFDADQDGQADEQYYSRRFLTADTREIRLYGLDGDDRFELVGAANSPIRLRIIGGTDDDQVRVNSRLAARIYDHPEGMELIGEPARIRDRRTARHPELNLYRFQDYRLDYAIPSPSLGFNIDDGFFFGAGILFRRHGFKPDPFAQEHRLHASYGTLNTIRFNYKGTFNNTFGRYADLLLNFDYVNENFIVNYFGIGNESPDQSNDDPDFNRSRQGYTEFSPRLRLRGRANRMAWEIGPYYQTVEVEEASSGFIANAGLPERIFGHQQFIGLKTQFDFNNLANPSLPDNGMVVRFNALYSHNLEPGVRRDYRQIKGSVSLYRFFGNQVLGIATRIGFDHISGQFDFWQAARLGGRTNFRAYRAERYLGNTSFYQNFDVRLRGFGFGKNSVPTMTGILLGFDHGRVWARGEDSQQWHFGYGGGVWIAPFSATILHLTYFTSEGNSRVAFGAGFPF